MSFYPPPGQGPGTPYGGYPQHQQPSGWGPYATPQPQLMLTVSRPGAIPLTPLSIGDLFSGVFATWRTAPGAVLLHGLGYGLVTFLLYLMAVAPAFVTMYVAFTTVLDGGLPTSEQIASGSVAIIVLPMLALVLLFLASVFFPGLVAIVTMRGTIGTWTGFFQSFRLLHGSYWKLIALSVLINIAVIALSVLAFLLIVFAVAVLEIPAELFAVIMIIVILTGGIPIVWLTIKLMLAPTVIAVEQVGPLTALRRSWVLTNNNFWRSLGMTLLVTVCIVIARWVISIPLAMLAPLFLASAGNEAEALTGFLLAQVVIVGVSSVVSGVLYALFTIFIALLYTDLRIRREGIGAQLAHDAESISGPIDEFSIDPTKRRSDSQSADLVPGRDVHWQPTPPPAGAPFTGPAGPNAPYYPPHPPNPSNPPMGPPTWS
ncbi:hypothetical protein [Auritidibacter sp. NML100628]|nr:hypothetical protein [Auritidibacter sp. NML100628]PXA77446.1 hypothetical protein DCC24_03815 [Auritidibacter sp. NML100628]